MKAATGVGHDAGQRALLYKDNCTAYRWLRNAAGQGDAAGERNRDVMYLKRRGVDRNRDQALKWLTISARQGHALAREYLWANRNISAESKSLWRTAQILKCKLGIIH